MKVRYHDECKWQDTEDGLAHQYVDADGEPLAEVALFDGESKLWKFEVMLPEKYRLEGATPRGLVYSQAAARRVAEAILFNTIVTRSV